MDSAGHGAQHAQGGHQSEPAIAPSPQWNKKLPSQTLPAAWPSSCLRNVFAGQAKLPLVDYLEALLARAQGPAFRAAVCASSGVTVKCLNHTSARS